MTCINTMAGYALEVKTDEDVERFGKLIFHEDISKNLIKDKEAVKNNLSVIKSSDYYACILYNDKNDIGAGIIKIFKAINNACIDVGILKEFRGKDAYEACKEGLNNFFKLYPEIELYSFVKKNNRPSLFFSMKLGLKLHKKVNEHYVLRYKNADSE